ncbi:MAG: rRNA maturation RNase YbeY [Bacteroidota bacterium]
MIQFHSEAIDFALPQEEAIGQWLKQIAQEKESAILELNYIFCSDDYLLELNRQYLQHDYYTDILTFPYKHPEQDGLWSDIYISVDRVRDNAKTFEADFTDELHRVMAHGLLHLLGYDDHGDAAPMMREQEALALAKRNF